MFEWNTWNVWNENRVRRSNWWNWPTLHGMNSMHHQFNSTHELIECNWMKWRTLAAATPINCLNSSRALKREWMGINGLQAEWEGSIAFVNSIQFKLIEINLIDWMAHALTDIITVLSYIGWPVLNNKA